jgi:hypothetical protein
MVAKIVVVAQVYFDRSIADVFYVDPFLMILEIVQHSRQRPV